MSELKDNQLVFVNDSGEEVLCDILFTYRSEEFNKDYVFFTPVGDVDKYEVSCASYVPAEDGIGELNEVTSEEEWEMLEEVFNTYISDGVEDEEQEGCYGCEGCEDCEGCDDDSNKGCGGCCHKG